MLHISARELALKVLRAVEEEGAFANIALNRVLEKYRPGKLDRAFATELAYGTLRSLNTLDWILGHFVKKPLQSQSTVVRNILRLGVYQLLFMEKVPPSAACNEGAELAKRYGHPGSVKFVNGVLRNVSRRHSEINYPSLSGNPLEHISLRYSHPVWMVERWLAEFGPEETIALCRANNKPAPNTIRTNTLKITRAGLVERLQGKACMWQKRHMPRSLSIGVSIPCSMRHFKKGYFKCRTKVPCWPAGPMPSPGSFVVDACSAPAAKPHLAQLMENRGKFSGGAPLHKLSLIRENCLRLGIDIVESRQGMPEICRGANGLADFVLVDAPCSGLGVLRRRPDARWRKIRRNFQPL